MLDKLHGDHDALRTILRGYSDLLYRGSADDLPIVTRRRVEFSGCFRNHIGAESQCIQTAMAVGSRPLKTLLEAYGAAFKELYFDYSAHVSLWRPHRISDDWPEYRAAVFALQRRLYDIMDWEEREIYPALTSGGMAPG